MDSFKMWTWHGDTIELKLYPDYEAVSITISNERFGGNTLTAFAYVQPLSFILQSIDKLRMDWGAFFMTYGDDNGDTVNITSDRKLSISTPDKSIAVHLTNEDMVKLTDAVVKIHQTLNRFMYGSAASAKTVNK